MTSLGSNQRREPRTIGAGMRGRMGFGRLGLALVHALGEPLMVWIHKPIPKLARHSWTGM